MLNGTCLCGGVAFAIASEPTPIELCHCPRCRKAYGSAFAATYYVLASAFSWTRGAELVTVFQAPLRENPPPYTHAFCATCGSPLPIVMPGLGVVEVPAGVVDDDPGARPLRHLFASKRASWFEITDPLPQYSEHVPPSEHLVRLLLKSRQV